MKQFWNFRNKFMLRTTCTFKIIAIIIIIIITTIIIIIIITTIIIIILLLKNKKIKIKKSSNKLI